MAEHPLPMSAPMVRAILDGSKTQTRRVAKKMVRHPDLGNLYTPGALVLEGEPQHVIERACPYGRPGDHLWVRETVFINHFMGLQVPVAERACCELYYRATDEADMRKWEDHEGIRWTPSIHMPRWASRITLEITSVRVERLQDISEADARAEGARECDRVSGREVLLAGQSQRGSYVLHYRDIWEQINGPGSWAANPWVWVLSFKKVAA